MRAWSGIVRSSIGSRGFSLVEIAIVLVVVGLIVSGGLLGLSPVLQANKVSQTNQQMDRIEQALVLYVIQNGCLPCPADPTTLNGAAAKGAASTYSTGCSGTGTACYDSQGLVPWVNLGLSKADVIDPYGSFIDYAVTTSASDVTSLTNLSTNMVRTPPSTYPAGGLTVTDASPTTQTNVAAYVLVSHGADGSYGFAAASGKQRSNPNSGTTTNQVANQATGTGPYTASTGFIQNQALGASASGGYFDDIVRFKTAPVIIQSCGTNACGNPA
jgi:prepilin-type N-terminal cleavage/methylation domain-containing protein